MKTVLVRTAYCLLTLLSFSILSCRDKSSLEKSSVQEKLEKIETTSSPPPQQLFLIDHCDSPYITVLEQDVDKGKDSCILRITSEKKNIHRVEVLNIPIDRSHIETCEEDYVSVSFACGGPCHSHVFVFTDSTRANEQYGYVQYVENSPNLITYVVGEEFEQKIIRNLANGKELKVDISDCQPMEYGRVDSLFQIQDELHFIYQANNEEYVRKKISLKPILR